MKIQGKQVGYVRVSTRAQIADRQIAALEEICDELYVEYESATARKRPVFDRAIAALKSGDAFVVLDLDRAFRSAIDAILTAEALRERGVHFRLLSHQVDTTTEEGELFYTILAAFAQYERRIISRRTKEGMAAARKRGSRIGRPKAISAARLSKARRLIELENMSISEAAKWIGACRVTLSRHLRRGVVILNEPDKKLGNNY